MWRGSGCTVIGPVSGGGILFDPRVYLPTLGTEGENVTRIVVVNSAETCVVQRYDSCSPVGTKVHGRFNRKKNYTTIEIRRRHIQKRHNGGG